jgi:hypothetical protein
MFVKTNFETLWQIAISSSHGYEHENGYLVGCCGM